MAEYSRMARGTFTSNGATKAVYLPFLPEAVNIWNYTASATPANNGIARARWDVAMGQGFALVDIFNATPVLTTDSVDLNGISTFEAGQMLQFGARQQVIGITKANPASINITAHGYQTGDVVMFQGLYQSSTTGMAQLDGMPFYITRTDADNFTIPWNTNQSNYTALSGSPSGAFVKKVLYPYLYAPGVAFISAITTGTTTTIDTTAAHNFVVGQEVAFRIPALYGTIQLNSHPNIRNPGSPIYGYVVSVTDYNTVVVNITSTGYTAFNSNQTIASVPGLQFAQILAVGDVNTGGLPISAGSDLYPSPVVNTFSTINGPAINGAFVNNTRQGFVVGAGFAAGQTSSVLVGANADVIMWEAFLYDYSRP